MAVFGFIGLSEHRFEHGKWKFLMDRDFSKKNMKFYLHISEKIENSEKKSKHFQKISKILKIRKISKNLENRKISKKIEKSRKNVENRKNLEKSRKSKNLEKSRKCQLFKKKSKNFKKNIFLRDV